MPLRRRLRVPLWPAQPRYQPDQPDSSQIAARQQPDSSQTAVRQQNSRASSFTYQVYYRVTNDTSAVWSIFSSKNVSFDPNSDLTAAYCLFYSNSKGYWCSYDILPGTFKCIADQNSKELYYHGSLDGIERIVQALNMKTQQSLHFRPERLFKP